MTKSKIYSHWKSFPVKDWHWPNFTPREMACKGDNSLLIDFDAMEKLQALRQAVGLPFVIHSAYRSPAHNTAVGGAPRSRHLIAVAFDIRMQGHDPHEFEAMARYHGFNGIGRYPKSETPFLHIDARPKSEAATWGPDFPFGEDEHLAPPPPPLPQPVVKPGVVIRLEPANPAPKGMISRLFQFGHRR